MLIPTLKRLAALLVLCWLAAMTLGCTSGGKPPSRMVETITWDKDTHSTTSLTRNLETGYQLWWGERHDTVATPQTYAASDISKRTMGTVVGGVAGVAAGAATGNPAIGAVAGTVAGAVGDTLQRSESNFPSLNRTPFTIIQESK
jgi:hypothetical protein